jgi:tRNA (pseudouridine54-N1)-methyltransferase
LDLNIVVDALRVRTSEEFLIRDVPGTSGRLDVICRILVSAYRTIPEFSTAIQVNAVFGGPPNPPLRLQVINVDTEEFPESELECALILKGLLHRYRSQAMSQDFNWPQFTITAQGFHETLEEVTQNTKQILYLVETGQPLEQVKLRLEQPIVVILGDDQGLTPAHEKLVRAKPVEEVSIGTRSLLGSQVISLFLLELNRRIE